MEKSLTSKKAYEQAKENGGAYVVRGRSIVRVLKDGTIEFIKKLGQAKTRLKENEKIVYYGKDEKGQ